MEHNRSREQAPTTFKFLPKFSSTLSPETFFRVLLKPFQSDEFGGKREVYSMSLLSEGHNLLDFLLSAAGLVTKLIAFFP